MHFFGRNKIDYKLEDVVEIRNEDPRHFIIPTKDEISKIKVGDEVKLIFKIINGKTENDSEKMSVSIIDISSGVFTGILIDEPAQITTIKKDNKIKFTYKNIAEVNRPVANFDMYSLVIITKRAVEKKEVNIAVKDNTFRNRKNNGWMLYYGDETDTNGNNADLFTKITVEEVLKFEPLLENVFNKDDGDYVFNKQVSEFMRLEE